MNSSCDLSGRVHIKQSRRLGFLNANALLAVSDRVRQDRKREFVPEMVFFVVTFEENIGKAGKLEANKVR
jgi:hypothetical protein